MAPSHKKTMGLFIRSMSDLLIIYAPSSRQIYTALIILKQVTLLFYVTLILELIGL